ncbi:glycosyl transferase family 90-domain-containing protein, partial [Mycena metata]
SNAKVDALYARQSTTLQTARARYSLRNKRPPPSMYDKWFDFAREHSCLIDDYDQITRDFEPFYQLAHHDPAYFKRMVVKSSAQVRQKFSWTDDQGTLYNGDWERTFGRFASLIPDMTAVLNGRDERRVLFNYRQPDGQLEALNASDATPFEHSPRPTASFFKDDMKCFVPNQPTGFTNLVNDASARVYTNHDFPGSNTDTLGSYVFTTDLYPVMSMCRINPCFGDILVPSEVRVPVQVMHPAFGSHPISQYANNISWVDKEPKLYWRGLTSGGRVFGDNYRAFPRFRLIEIGKKHRKTMNVVLSGFHGDLCEQCNEGRIKMEYEIASKGSPREDVYKYKFLMDVDGNSFSGRYLGLLRSGSLVFKSTAFAEFFNDWLIPYEHYIPVLPDLSDLVDKVNWAVENDDEAHRIQQAGQAFAERVLTNDQNDCYFSRVLLEWARLEAMTDAAGATR